MMFFARRQHWWWWVWSYQRRRAGQRCLIVLHAQEDDLDAGAENSNVPQAKFTPSTLSVVTLTICWSCSREAMQLSICIWVVNGWMASNLLQNHPANSYIAGSTTHRQARRRYLVPCKLRIKVSSRTTTSCVSMQVIEGRLPLFCTQLMRTVWPAKLIFSPSIVFAN